MIQTGKAYAQAATDKSKKEEKTEEKSAEKSTDAVDDITELKESLQALKELLNHYLSFLKDTYPLGSCVIGWEFEMTNLEVESRLLNILNSSLRSLSGGMEFRSHLESALRYGFRFKVEVPHVFPPVTCRIVKEALI
ncbi:hypothetical protein AVEN_87113-1 [Araneus ventricosus]|uniref:Uncharacterized protein n=1 Tax=Araneus ventricosus TaxID=182803 RepID=A0A4Y2P7U3_ARAVE|nr:hypothetical protein AVEN_87113-1 [Araneus ventricosus]